MPGLQGSPLLPLDRLVAGALALTVGLAPLSSARAASPDEPTLDPVRFAEPPPEPEPEPEPGQPLRIVAEDPPAPEAVAVVEPPPPPFAEAPAPVYEPAPSPAPRIVDSRRPMPGTGLVALGALGMGMTTAMLITAMAGPGWGDLERRDAAILAGLSLPVALASSGMLIGGIKAHRRHERWADRNGVHPPRPGNGLLVAGTAVSVVGVASMGVTIQHAITDPTPTRGNWAAVGVTGLLAGVGIAVTTSGMIARSKFAAWERSAYLSPGPMALEGGGGLSLSGRF